MENIKIKHKEFEVVEIVSKDTFKANYKNKTYLIKKYESDSVKFDMLKKIIKSAVSMPKVIRMDKKAGYVAFEIIEGVLMSDYILENDFNENIYKQIFRNSYSARVVGLNLDYSLDKWMIANDTLYYVGEYCEKYDPKYDFTKEKIREWFLTKDLVAFYKNKGILFDKNRLKDEFSVNKDIVLMTCKYYV